MCLYSKQYGKTIAPRAIPYSVCSALLLVDLKHIQTMFK